MHSGQRLLAKNILELESILSGRKINFLWLFAEIKGLVYCQHIEP